MVMKRLLCPQRVRQLANQFSWVDQRLVRDKHIGRCGSDALALYLFLVTVADAKGLSYYSDGAITSRLPVDARQLFSARSELQQVGLIAYDAPIYQVLALNQAMPPAKVFKPKPATGRRHLQPEAVSDLLRRALEGRNDQL